MAGRRWVRKGEGDHPWVDGPWAGSGRAVGPRGWWAPSISWTPAFAGETVAKQGGGGSPLGRWPLGRLRTGRSDREDGDRPAFPGPPAFAGETVGTQGGGGSPLGRWPLGRLRTGRRTTRMVAAQHFLDPGLRRGDGGYARRRGCRLRANGRGGYLITRTWPTLQLS